VLLSAFSQRKLAESAPDSPSFIAKGAEKLHPPLKPLLPLVSRFITDLRASVSALRPFTSGHADRQKYEGDSRLVLYLPATYGAHSGALLRLLNKREVPAPSGLGPVASIGALQELPKLSQSR
jgi:hypothetical protein